MNGIRRKSIPQEIFEYQYRHTIDSDEDMKDVENFYNQYEGSDVVQDKWSLCKRILEVGWTNTYAI